MNEVYNDLFNINPKVSTSVGFLLGLLLIGDLTANQQNAVGNWLILVGQVILTNAASQYVIESRVKDNVYNINSKMVKREYNPLVYDIEYLKSILRKHGDNSLEDLELLEKIILDVHFKIEQLKK